MDLKFHGLGHPGSIPGVRTRLEPMLPKMLPLFGLVRLRKASKYGLQAAEQCTESIGGSEGSNDKRHKRGNGARRGGCLSQTKWRAKLSQSLQDPG